MGKEEEVQPCIIRFVVIFSIRWNVVGSLQYPEHWIPDHSSGKDGSGITTRVPMNEDERYV